MTTILGIYLFITLIVLVIIFSDENGLKSYFLSLYYSAIWPVYLVFVVYVVIGEYLNGRKKNEKRHK